ncbi:N-acetyl sugar amidotransferase [Candidatus Dependentiae bacterium]|nr:N-acetyl sugar amidotransferase [Candidatus Dependentiae bacterium]
MKFCKKCVLPDTRPGVELNEDGICYACIGAAEKKEEIDWAAREQELIKILNENKSKDSGWDCIVPVSGGKDSTWQIYNIKKRYNLNPLALTYKAPCRNSLGAKNLQNLINIGVDHIDFTVNPKVEKRFMLKALEEKGAVALLIHMICWALALKFAVKFGIKLVVWGENTGLEYGGNKNDRENPYLNHEWMRKFGGMNDTFAEDWIGEDLTKQDMYPFIIPSDEELKKAQVSSLFLGWFLKWDPLEVAEFSKNVGFSWADKPTIGYYPFCDLDDDLIVMHHFFKWPKFGITRMWDNLAIEIRNERMTRTEAVNYIKNNPEPLPEYNINALCNYLEISRERFWEIVESHRNKKIWHKENGKWILPAVIEEFGFMPEIY